MTGFGILLRKELVEAWRTRRLPVVAVLFLVVGIMSPLTARYLNEILAMALGDQLPMTLPDPTVATALEQFQKNLGQMGALAALALAMGSVSGELDRGTAALIMAQPVGRPAFLAAKLVALAAVLGVAILLASAVAWAY
ncbi:MAG: ABC transporter permease subunit, partial [Candidatus Limnocylindrales bacterium]